MIKVIFGGKGSGKSKRLLDFANGCADGAKGNLVFIDDGKDFIHDLDRKIRFIDAAEYGIISPKFFTGFLHGLAASDFDLEYIFVDSFLTIVRYSLYSLTEMFERLETFTNERNITLVISISGEGSDLPEYIRKYII